MTDHEAQCSFCKKPRAEVRALVAGPGVSICDDCVALCNEILAEARTTGDPGAALPTARAKDTSWRRWLRRVF